MPSVSDPIRVPPPSGRFPRALAGGSSPEAGAHTAGQGGGGWWIGSAGIALLLAVTGAVFGLARKRWPNESTRMLRVVGRVGLSPRHSIFLVQAGQRVLLIGTGGQGAPSLLGELSGSDLSQESSDPGRLAAARMELGPGDEE
jgi:hypothetical protein